MSNRSGPGRPVHLRTTKGKGKRNPPGSKVGRRAVEHTGGEWKGEIFHSGALTAVTDKHNKIPALPT